MRQGSGQESHAEPWQGSWRLTYDGSLKPKLDRVPPLLISIREKASLYCRLSAAFDLAPITSLISSPITLPSFTLLRLHWPLHCSSDMSDTVLPQGLCTGCPRSLTAHAWIATQLTPSPPSGSVYTSHFSRKAFPDHHISNSAF